MERTTEVEEVGRRRDRPRPAATGVEGEVRFARFRASRHALLEEELEDGEAELPDLAAWSRTVGDDGTHDGGDDRLSGR